MPSRDPRTQNPTSPLDLFQLYANLLASSKPTAHIWSKVRVVIRLHGRNPTWPETVDLANILGYLVPYSPSDATQANRRRRNDPGERGNQDRSTWCTCVQDLAWGELTRLQLDSCPRFLRTRGWESWAETCISTSTALGNEATSKMTPLLDIQHTLEPQQLFDGSAQQCTTSLPTCSCRWIGPESSR